MPDKGAASITRAPADPSRARCASGRRYAKLHACPNRPIPLLAALAYLIAAGGLVRSLREGNTRSRAVLWLALPAIVLHAATHAIGWSHLHGPDLHFFAALSLVGLGMAALSTLAAGTQRMEALGVIIYPFAGVLVLLYHFAGHGQSPRISTGACNSTPGWRCLPTPPSRWPR